MSRAYASSRCGCLRHQTPTNFNLQIWESDQWFMRKQRERQSNSQSINRSIDRGCASLSQRAQPAGDRAQRSDETKWRGGGLETRSCWAYDVSSSLVVGLVAPIFGCLRRASTRPHAPSSIFLIHALPLHFVLWMAFGCSGPSRDPQSSCRDLRV